MSVFVSRIYFLGTADKIATTAILRVETISHFTGNHNNISKFASALLVFFFYIASL